MSMHISQNVEEWRNTTARSAKNKTTERKQNFLTSSNIEVPDLATEEDLQNFDAHDKLGYPGEFPFTRGIHPGMYRSRLWTMRQYAGFGTAEESNKRYHFLLSHGTTGLSVAFDLPTQMGYDADHPFAAGEVGKVGVSISSQSCSILTPKLANVKLQSWPRCASDATMSKYSRYSPPWKRAQEAVRTYSH